MVSLRWAWAPEPASWLEGAPFLKIPRWADASAPSPFYPWDWLPAHPKAAMMIIKALQQTAGAGSASGVRSSPMPPRLLSLFVRHFSRQYGARSMSIVSRYLAVTQGNLDNHH